jgi:dTDP-glucose 4,6-dehydratase
MAFHKSFATPVVIIRPFNTYGPRQSARAVIPAVITQIASGEREIKLGAVHPTRDFNYIKDTVRGFIAVAKSDITVGEVINIGSNYEISIRRLVELIADIMQTKVEIQTEQERLRPEKSEVERLWADNSKVQKLTEWKPQYAGQEGLKRGLTETIAWFSDTDNLKRYRSGIYNL